MAQEWRFFGRTLKDIHSHLGAPCHATLLNGKTYSGYLYNVDPETYTLLILQLQEQPENETQTQSHAGHEVDTKQDTVKRGLSMTAVRRHATKEFGIDTSTSESLTLQEMDSMVRVLSNIGSPEQVKARKDRLVASLQSKRIPVATSEDDAIVHIMNCAHVRPPYYPSSVECDNIVMRDRVKGMIQDIDAQSREKVQE